MASSRLTRNDYLLPTKKLAKILLGKELRCRSDEGTVSGIIVETEAYLPANDPACHAARGKTKRNVPMFGPPGHAYVYFCYGNFWLFNVVSEPEGTPGAVLIRALEPLKGKELITRRRPKAKKEFDLLNGPGKLVMGLGINKGDNGKPLFTGRVGIYDIGMNVTTRNIIATTRIGITEGTDMPLRYYIKDNRFISKK